MPVGPGCPSGLFEGIYIYTLEARDVQANLKVPEDR